MKDTTYVEIWLSPNSVMFYIKFSFCTVRYCRQMSRTAFYFVGMYGRCGFLPSCGGGGGRPKIFELKRGGIPKINEGRGVMLIYVPV